MPRAYITIDDSPSPDTGMLVDFLARNKIQALIFCRGDHMENNLAPMVKALDRGMVLGNHSYDHRSAGMLSYEEIVTGIEMTESLIDLAYQQAGQKRHGRYFRFPYLDKGDGDKLEQRFSEIMAQPQSVILSGHDTVQRVQDYLYAEGFSQPFQGVTHPLYQNKDIAHAADCLLTYSSCDWMLTSRHKGQWPYQTVEDLQKKMEDDPWLLSENGAQIALFHDQPEIVPVAMILIQYMKDQGVIFLDIEPEGI